MKWRMETLGSFEGVMGTDVYIYIHILYMCIYIHIDSLGIFPNNGGCMGLCMVVSRLCSVRRCTGLGFTEIPQIMVECLAGFVHQPHEQ